MPVTRRATAAARQKSLQEAANDPSFVAVPEFLPTPSQSKAAKKECSPVGESKRRHTPPTVTCPNDESAQLQAPQQKPAGRATRNAPKVARNNPSNIKKTAIAEESLNEPHIEQTPVKKRRQATNKSTRNKKAKPAIEHDNSNENAPNDGDPSMPPARPQRRTGRALVLTATRKTSPTAVTKNSKNVQRYSKSAVSMSSESDSDQCQSSLIIKLKIPPSVQWELQNSPSFQKNVKLKATPPKKAKAPSNKKVKLSKPRKPKEKPEKKVEPETESEEEEKFQVSSQLQEIINNQLYFDTGNNHPPRVEVVTQNHALLLATIHAVVKTARLHLDKVVKFPTRLEFKDALFYLSTLFEQTKRLVKWIRIYNDPTRLLINLVGHLESQASKFDTVLSQGRIWFGVPIWAVKKPDFETALQVFVHGEVIYPNHRAKIQPPRLKPQTIYGVLQDLNAVLRQYITLSKFKLAPIFHQYEVRDGRIIFTVPSLMRIEVSTTDGVASQFFLVGVQWIFNNTLIKDHAAVHAKLQVEADRVAAALGLHAMLHMLVQFALRCQLEILFLDFRQLSRNMFYNGQFQVDHIASKGLLRIRYWNGEMFVGMKQKRGASLGLKWFIDGCEQKNGMDFDQSFYSAELLMKAILYKHVQHLMGKVHIALKQYWKPYFVQLQLNQEKTAIAVKNDTHKLAFSADWVTGSISVARLIHGEEHDFPECINLCATTPAKVADDIIRIQCSDMTRTLVRLARNAGWERTKIEIPVDEHERTIGFSKPGWPRICILIAILDPKALFFTFHVGIQTGSPYAYAKQAQMGGLEHLKGLSLFRKLEVVMKKVIKFCEYAQDVIQSKTEHLLLPA